MAEATDYDLLEDEDGAPFPEEVQVAHRLVVDALTVERDELDKRVDTLRDELAYAIRTRDEWESNATKAEAEFTRVADERDRAEAEVAVLREKVEHPALAGVLREVRDSDHVPMHIAADASQVLVEVLGEADEN